MLEKLEVQPSDATRLTPRRPSLTGKKSLKPLNNGKSGISNMTDCGPQLAVEHLERRVVLGWRAS